ncbi:EAL domain-containing protein [Segnochrobactrum spirostomi]|uniref:EAL domain-containing protein n=1 Tax=Segnochrobactrum spirostomi TaxID=2608987 RepID=A0A6A7Y329_9HYPH|nr:EAL domain-containing protein [Segnochrobactrum spirostomi]MQT13514.1 EAL domain-containing protein [Segnochrobactrum spirostomi]
MPKLPRTMVLCDDESELAEELAEFFASYGWTVRTCRDGVEAERNLAANPPPTCLVTDLNMPGGDGETLLAVIRSLPRAKRPPILAVMTGHALVTTQPSEFGVDFLYRKPADPFGMAHDFDERLQTLEATADASDEGGEEALPEPAPGRRRVLLLDDDEAVRTELEDYLEGLGHRVVAIADAGLLRSRPAAACDVLILDLKLAETDGVAVLRQFQNDEAAPDLILLSGQGEGVLKTASAIGEQFGLRILGAVAKPIDVDRLAALLALPSYPATSTSAHGSDPRRITEALIAALDERTLPIAFQPKVGARDLRFAGAEALLAGNLPGLGPVAPSDILAAAAASPPLMGRLTQAVIRSAIAGCRTWKARGWHGPVSINLPVEAVTGVMGTAELGTLAAHGIGPEDVILELVEDALYDSSTQVLAALTQLRLAGFALSLDDVGRRQSGLLQIANLPISEIKIDLELLRQSRTWSKAREIFATVAELGHRLGLTVVAEGVEHPADLELVRQYPVDFIQGYFISSKRPLDDLLAMGTEFDMTRRRYSRL